MPPGVPKHLFALGVVSVSSIAQGRTCASQHLCRLPQTPALLDACVRVCHNHSTWGCDVSICICKCPPAQQHESRGQSSVELTTSMIQTKSTCAQLLCTLTFRAGVELRCCVAYCTMDASWGSRL